MKEKVEHEVATYKDQFKKLVDDEIDKITNGHKQLDENLKKLINQIIDNLKNPEKVKIDIENCIQNELIVLIKDICKK